MAGGEVREIVRDMGAVVEPARSSPAKLIGLITVVAPACRASSSLSSFRTAMLIVSAARGGAR
jgi:hypothetical protein